MSCLYVTENGATIGLQKHRLEIKYRGGEEQSIPIETLESIEVFGKTQVTGQAITECMQRGIPLSFHSRGGYFLGSVIPAGNTNACRQRVQFRTSENEEFSLQLSRNIIKAKIHNQMVLLRRYARNGCDDVDEEIGTILRIERRIDRCNSRDEIMGCEGYAARQYFKGLGKLVKEEFAFTQRSKRPPKDEFNALLSLGYSILLHEIYAKIEKKE